MYRVTIVGLTHVGSATASLEDLEHCTREPCSRYIVKKNQLDLILTQQHLIRRTPLAK